MTAFDVHTPATAPEGSRRILEETQRALGFVPNLYGVVAESPPALEAYARVAELLDRSSLTPSERQVVLLATSYENACAYCMAAHSTIAGAQRIPGDVVTALRNGAPLADPRLEALRRFTRQVVQEGGWVAAEDVESFLDAGFTRAHVLEVVLGVGMKTLSNYTSHITGVPLDRAFEAQAWTAPVAASL